MKLLNKYIIVFCLFLGIILEANIRLQVNNLDTTNVKTVFTNQKYLFLFNNNGNVSILDKKTMIVHKILKTLPYISNNRNRIHIDNNYMLFPSKDTEITLVDLKDFSLHNYKANTKTSYNEESYDAGALSASDKYLFINGKLLDKNDNLIDSIKGARYTKKVIIDDNHNLVILIYENKVDIYDISLKSIVKSILTPNIINPFLTYPFVYYDKKNTQLYYKLYDTLNRINIKNYDFQSVEFDKVTAVGVSHNKIMGVHHYKDKKILAHLDFENSILKDTNITLPKKSVYSYHIDNDDIYIMLNNGDLYIKNNKKMKNITQKNKHIFYLETYKDKKLYFSLNPNEITVQLIDKNNNIESKLFNIKDSNYKHPNNSYKINVIKYKNSRFFAIKNSLYLYNIDLNIIKKIDAFDSEIKNFYIKNINEIYVFVESGVIKVENGHKKHIKNIFVKDAINVGQNVLILNRKDSCFFKRLNINTMELDSLDIMGAGCYTLTKHPFNKNEVITFIYNYGFGYKSKKVAAHIDVNHMSYKTIDKNELLSDIYFNKDQLELLSPKFPGNLEIYDLLKYKKKYEIENVYNKNYNYIDIKNNLLRIVQENKINLFNINSYKLVMSEYIFDNSIIYVTPDGFFSGSGNFEKYIHYLKDEKEVIKFDQFYDHFYRPDLVKLKLQGKEKEYQEAINSLSYEEALKNPPPKIKLTNVDKQIIENSGFENQDVAVNKNKVKLIFNVKEHDNGGIGLIRIYQEGKLIKTIGEGKINKQAANVDTLVEQDNINDKMKLAQNEYINKMSETVTRSVDTPISEEDSIGVVKTSSVQNKEGEYEIELDLMSGKNEIAIEAFNKTNTVTSYKEIVNINATIPKKEPKLYAIVAGVNKFEAKWASDLKYSENDAKAIKEAIENEKGKKYTDIEIKYHVGEDVTKDKILKSIQEISKKATLEDTIIFYISTHGKVYKGDLLLIPQNNANIRNAINFEDIFKNMQEVKALKQIFVLDTCESGKANDIVSAVYDSKASVLAKSSGVHMLLATTKGTYAFEHPDPKVKNGVFTHKILSKLKDKEIDKNKDNFISILELSEKLKEPSNNEDYQYPIIRNVGGDILVKKVGDE